MRKLIGLLTLLVFTTQAFGASTRTIEAQNTEGFFSSRNLAVDAGFEGKNKGAVWVASGGSLSTTTTSPGRGSVSGTWDASANAQTLKSKLVTIPAGMYGKNGVVSCTFKAASGTAAHTLTAYDGSANVVTAQTITSSTSIYARTSVNFVFPSSGSIQILISATQDEVSINIDDCFLGLSDGFNLYQVSQAQFIGSAYSPTTASCLVSRTNTALGAFTTTAACPGPTVEFNPGPGVIQTTDANDPTIYTVNNLPPGFYKVTMSGRVYIATSNQQAALAINDGTTTSGQVGFDATTAGATPAVVTGWFNYTTAANHTFQMYGSSAANALSVDSSGNNERVSFTIERYPSVSETAYRPELYNWRVDASISGANPSMGSSAQTAYVGIEDTGLTLTNNTVTGSNVLTAQIPCSSTNAPSGTTCSSGSESVGVSWTQPIEGDVKACASFSHGHNGASNQSLVTFQIVETATNAQTILQEGKDRISSGRSVAATNDDTYPLKVCGTFHLTAGQKALRLMYEQPAAVTTNVIYGDASSTNGQRDIHWTVEPITQSVPVPFVAGGVSSGSSGMERIERVSIENTGGTASTKSQSGSWISSYTNPATGQVTATMAAGIWSAAPTCSCVVASGDTTGWCFQNGATTTTSLVLRTKNAAGTDTNADVDVICMGPR